MNFLKNIFLKKKKYKPNLENAKSEPNILYKYRDWNNVHHKKTIMNNNIYYSSPSLFNDPFDCKISKNLTLLNTSEKKQKYARELVKDNSKNLSESEIEMQIAKKITEMEDIEKYLADYEKNMNKLHDERIGILSLSSRWNSTLMWSHYSDFHKGFCIGFDSELLKNPIFGKYKKVEYHKVYPEFEPTEKIKNSQLNMPFIKNKDWEYEQEYRFMQLFPNPFIGRITSLGNEFIKEINLGLLMPENHKGEIIKIAKEKNWKVYQINKVPFKFELTRIEL